MCTPCPTHPSISRRIRSRTSCSISPMPARLPAARLLHRRGVDATRGTVMPKVIYSMIVSLDGFVAGPGGEIDWSAPDEELHRFHNERVSDVGVQLCGRRLYEVMRFWDTPEVREPSAPEHVREFARIWERLPKIVFSSTLDRVEGNARLATGGVTDELARIQEQAG